MTSATQASHNHATVTPATRNRVCLSCVSLVAMNVALYMKSKSQTHSEQVSPFSFLLPTRLPWHDATNKQKISPLTADKYNACLVSSYYLTVGGIRRYCFPSFLPSWPQFGNFRFGNVPRLRCNRRSPCQYTDTSGNSFRIPSFR